jgi:hypothetical protein
MAFTIPNEPDATYFDQAEPDAGDFQMIAAAFDQTGVVSGCAVSAQITPDMTVAVASGTVIVAGTLATVTSGNLSLTSASSVSPRFDLVVANSSGVKTVVAGTPSSNPVFPSIPGSSVVLAAVYVPVNQTAIQTNKLVDKRLFIRQAAGSVTESVAVFEQPGTLTVVPGQGRYLLRKSGSIVGVDATVSTAPTGSSLIVDVNKNGTTIFTTQANRCAVAAGSNANVSTAIPDVTAFSARDYLTVDIDQVGSTVAGADLVVQVTYIL